MDLLKSLLYFMIPSAIAVSGFPGFALFLYVSVALYYAWNFVSYSLKTFP